MPLGFAKSTFTYAAASATQDVGWWTQAGAVDAGNQVCQKVVLGSNQTNSDFVFSCWFRADSSNDFDSDFDAFELFRLGQVDNNSGAFIIELHKNNGIQVMLFGMDGGGGGTNFSTGNLSGTFNSTYVDGNWHHLLAQGIFSNTSKAKIFLDGVDKTTNTLGSSAALVGSFHMGKQMSFGGRANGGADKEFGGDLTQAYVDLGSTTDYTSSLTKFYDSGYVDMGTDGTGSSADAPEVFLYVNSTPAVVNGGSTGTLSLSTSNTMTVNATGGPS